MSSSLGEEKPEHHGGSPQEGEEEWRGVGGGSSRRMHLAQQERALGGSRAGHPSQRITRE